MSHFVTIRLETPPPCHTQMNNKLWAEMSRNILALIFAQMYIFSSLNTEKLIVPML